MYTQEISCACATLLCMLWARHPRGQGPKKGAVQGPGPAQRLFWVPGPWGPWPRACTRVLRMRKRSLVYTQEILLCIHKKCINVTPGVMLRHCWPLLRHYWPLLRHYFYYIESINDFNIFCYHNITLLLYHNILLSRYSIIILTNLGQH